MSNESADQAPPVRIKDPSFWISEQAVYGVILVGGLILVASEYGEASWETFWTVIVTVLVFWAAHVFAGVIAHHKFQRGVNGSLPEAVREALAGARGLLLAAVLPCFILFLGSAGVIGDPEAIEWALWSGILVLGWIGYVIFWRAGYTVIGRLIGGLVTGAFGLVLIIVKALVH